MRILLVAINAKYIHSNLAVYSLKAYAEKYGANDHKIDIAEYTINWFPEEIIRDIYEKNPDVIGFSCYIWNISIVKEIISDYKKISPGTKIWVGGPEVSYNMEQVLLENPGIDYVMYGEGEKIFGNVMNAYGSAKDIGETELEKIKGIAFRKSGKVIVTSPESLVNLSDIPFVYKDMKKFENRIIYYESSRGCPFSCSYCLSSVDKKLRFRDVDMVKRELKFFIEHRTAQVKFVDRTFNCRHDYAMDIWKFIRDNDNGITNFHFEIAADLMTPDEIELIKTMRPGLIQLEIGVQSVNEKTLEAICRKTDISKIAEVSFQLGQTGNVHRHLDLIAGLPYENYASFANSFNRVYDMNPDLLQLGFLKVLHGSVMKEKAQDFGIIYSGRPPYEVLSTRWLSFDEILKLKSVENVVEIYYNSLQFVNTITKLAKCFDSAFQMYEKLGEYYKKCSADGAKHSRVTRYVLLLNFISDWKIYTAKIDMKKWRELLTLDYYLRENAKNRPEFSADISEDKSRIRDFYKSDKVREILPDYSDYDSRQIEKMTHVEVFGIDSGQKTYILFDYNNRNPLNRQARIINITEWIKDELSDKGLCKR